MDGFWGSGQPIAHPSKQTPLAGDPVRRRIAVAHAQQSGASERHACQLVHPPRGTQPRQGLASLRRSAKPLCG